MRLYGYRLVFRGHIDFAPDPAGSVWGGLYGLSDACLRALDHYEESPAIYRRIGVTVDRNGTPCEAMAYIMNKTTIAPPSVAYYGEIARGYADWNLDTAPLRRARLDVLHKPAYGAPSVTAGKSAIRRRR